MPQNITLGYRALVDAANKEVKTVPTAEAIKLAGRDDVVLVDVRDIRELAREGRVPGAFHCPRGMLEFWIDPTSPYHKPIFFSGQAFRILLRWRVTFGARRADRAAHGPQARRPYRRRLRGLEEGGRAGGRSGREAEEGVSRDDAQAGHWQQELFFLVAAALDRDEGRRHSVRGRNHPAV